MTQRFYVDANGKWIGSFDGAQPPAGAIEVETPPDDARQVWNGEGWSSVPAALPAPSLVANALITVDAGILDGLSTAAALSFAFAIGTGLYWVFFTEAMPDLNYSCNVNTSAGHANVTDRQTTYFEIAVTNGVVPVDPAELSVQVFRTI